MFSLRTAPAKTKINTNRQTPKKTFIAQKVKFNQSKNLFGPAAINQATGSRVGLADRF